MTTTPPTITMDQVCEHLYSAVICDALDSMGFANQSPLAMFAPMTGCDRLVGRAKTTLWADMAHEDPRPYDLEFLAVDACKPGDILVNAAGGSMRSGIWGELLSTAARNSGCIGALVDGAVRDTVQMTKMGFPVFAKGRSIYDSLNRQRAIDVDVSVLIDGVRIAPGDLLFIDIDGVVVVPQAIEKEALHKAWTKVHAENITRDAIHNGMKAAAAYEKYGIL